MFNPDDIISMVVTENTNGREVKVRTLIGRLYYGCYHLVCKHVGVNPNTKHDTSTHIFLQNHLLSVGKPQLYSWMKTLHGHRVKADYYNNKSMGDQDLNNAKIQARFVLQDIGNPLYKNLPTQQTAQTSNKVLSQNNGWRNRFRRGR